MGCGYHWFITCGGAYTCPKRTTTRIHNRCGICPGTFVQVTLAWFFLLRWWQCVWVVFALCQVRLYLDHWNFNPLGFLGSPTQECTGPHCPRRSGHSRSNNRTTGLPHLQFSFLFCLIPTNYWDPRPLFCDAEPNTNTTAWLAKLTESPARYAPPDQGRRRIMHQTKSNTVMFVENLNNVLIT